MKQLKGHLPQEEEKGCDPCLKKKTLRELHRELERELYKVQLKPRHCWGFSPPGTGVAFMVSGAKVDGSRAEGVGSE